MESLEATVIEAMCSANMWLARCVPPHKLAAIARAAIDANRAYDLYLLRKAGITQEEYHRWIESHKSNHSP